MNKCLFIGIPSIGDVNFNERINQLSKYGNVYVYFNNIGKLNWSPECAYSMDPSKCGTLSARLNLMRIFLQTNCTHYLSTDDDDELTKLFPTIHNYMSDYIINYNSTNIVMKYTEYLNRSNKFNHIHRTLASGSVIPRSHVVKILDRFDKVLFDLKHPITLFDDFIFSQVTLNLFDRFRFLPECLETYNIKGTMSRSLDSSSYEQIELESNEALKCRILCNTKYFDKCFIVIKSYLYYGLRKLIQLHDSNFI